MFLKKDDNKIADFIEQNETKSTNSVQNQVNDKEIHEHFISKSSVSTYESSLVQDDIIDSSLKSDVLQNNSIADQAEGLRQSQDLQAQTSILEKQISPFEKTDEDVTSSLKPQDTKDNYQKDDTIPHINAQDTSNKNANYKDLSRTNPDINNKVSDFYANSQKQEEQFRLRKLQQIPDMYAGFWVRLLAFVIDSIIVKSFLSILSDLGITKLIPIDIDFMFILLFAIYSLLTVSYLNGQTIGKLLTRIRVVSDTSKKLDFTTLLVRELAGKIVLVKFGILFVFLLFSSRKHHIVDYLAGTSVINDKYCFLFNEIMFGDTVNS